MAWQRDKCNPTPAIPPVRSPLASSKPLPQSSDYEIPQDRPRKSSEFGPGRDNLSYVLGPQRRAYARRSSTLTAKILRLRIGRSTTRISFRWPGSFSGYRNREMLD